MNKDRDGIIQIMLTLVTGQIHHPNSQSALLACLQISKSVSALALRTVR